MKTLFMPGATPNERVAELNKICYNRGDDTFQRTLTQSEIDVEKDNYFKYLNEENTLKEEMKNTVEDFQKKIKAASKEKEECFETVKTGQREVRDKLYWVVDEESGKMLKYDRYGELISTRALTPEETNRRLFSNDEVPALDDNDHVPGDVFVDEDIKDIADVDYENDSLNLIDAPESAKDVLDEVINNKISDQESQETPKKPTRKKKTDN